jgi:hypothetical protein
MGSLLFLAFTVTFPHTVHAAIFKWKDDQGKTHFTDDRSKIPPQFRKQKPHFAPPRNRSKAPPPAGKQQDWIGSPETQASSRGPVVTFYAMDSSGRRKVIDVDSNTALFAVATWCHYSKKFINYLNDPNIAAKMREIKFIFLFKDEWPTIKKNLDKSVAKGELTQAQADKRLNQLKQKADWGMLYDPSFTNDLPSEYYFATDRFKKLKSIYPKAIPQAYSASKNNFENSVSQWIRSQFKGEKETRDFLVAEYKKYNKGKK